MSLFILLVTAVSLTVFIIYCVNKKKFKYWKKKNIPHIPPVLVLGNYAEHILLKKHLREVTQNICQRFPNAPYIGAYYGTDPTLIVQDPEHLKLVMTKDFYFFSGRELSKYVHREVIIHNLFSTYGDNWKVLRQNLTPLFTSSKMRNMFLLIEKCSRIFEKMLDHEVKFSKEIEATSLMARFTMDCICSCSFGIDTNTMERKEGNPFSAIGEAIFEYHAFRTLKLIVRSIWPDIFYALGLTTIPHEVGIFFRNVLTGIFESHQYEPTSRNDFVDFILKLKKNKVMLGDSLSKEKEKVSLKIDDDFIVAQCTLFFAAGYESSALTMGFTIFELANNPEIQEKVFEEIDAYLRRHDNVLKYECVAETPYLEACVNESLRLYPVLGVVTREVTEDYTFPSGLKVEKGLRVHLPVYHLHHNPEHYPEPEQFRPERFLGDEKRNIKPYTYMPFGEGPRICIGMRFAKMQIVAGLITLLKKYRLELAPGMKSTVELEPKSLITKPIGGIRVKLIEREGWEQRLLKAPTLN